MAGNTLGGFDPMDQIRHVASCVCTKATFLSSMRGFTASSREPTEAQKGFAFAPLASVGIVAVDGELKFAENEDNRWPGLFILTRRFQASRDLNVF